MKALLFSTTIVLCLMVGSIMCQEEEGSDGGSLMTRFKNMMKSFFKELKDFWSEFKQEVKARTTDMRDWTKEMMESFKQKMKEWIDNASDASDSEKNEMRDYLEKLQMEQQ